jgi:hypothetical protein
MKHVFRASALALALVACSTDEKDGIDTDVIDTETVDTEPVDTEVVDSDTDQGTTLSCTTYCAAVQAACTGDFAQYPTTEACETLCTGSGIAAGTPLDTNTNTLGCRTYHAGVAAAGDDEAKGTHCPHAGLLGGDMCGGLVENFCAIDLHVCTGEDAAYPSADDCETTAATWDFGTPGEMSGNTFSCRAYHLGAAILAGAGTHCPHTAADGGGQCVDVTLR